MKAKLIERDSSCWTTVIDHSLHSAEFIVQLHKDAKILADLCHKQRFFSDEFDDEYERVLEKYLVYEKPNVKIFIETYIKNAAFISRKNQKRCA